MEMSQDAKRVVVDELKLDIIAKVSYLALLRKTCNSREEWKNAYPMFNDVTVKGILDAYDKIAAIRGW